MIEIDGLVEAPAGGIDIDHFEVFAGGTRIELLPRHWQRGAVHDGVSIWVSRLGSKE